MQNLAIFGDIHANLPALEAVLADIEARDLSSLYCLGDLVGYGTFPNELIELIREWNIPTIMGNYDQGVGNNSDDCGCAYTVRRQKHLAGVLLPGVTKIPAETTNSICSSYLHKYLWNWMDSAFGLYTAARVKSINTCLPTGLMLPWSAC